MLKWKQLNSKIEKNWDNPLFVEVLRQILVIHSDTPKEPNLEKKRANLLANLRICQKTSCFGKKQGKLDDMILKKVCKALESFTRKDIYIRWQRVNVLIKTLKSLQQKVCVTFMISAKSTKCVTEVFSSPIFSDGIYTIDTKIQFDSYWRKATVKNYNCDKTVTKT